jgi:hypothetical protein
MYKDETVIELSKGKIIILTLGSIGFVALGGWVLTLDRIPTRYNEYKVIGFAIAGIVFFGMCGVYGLIKTFDRKPGLVISSEGIQDNSSAISGQFISWQNVVGFKEVAVQGTRILLIRVNNCNQMLATAGAWRRFWMKLSVKQYGTPVSITASSLKCSFEELKAIMEKEFDKSTNAQHNTRPTTSPPKRKNSA